MRNSESSSSAERDRTENASSSSEATERVKHDSLPNESYRVLINKFEQFELLVEMPADQQAQALAEIALHHAEMASDLRLLLARDAAFAEHGESELQAFAFGEAQLLNSQMAQELPQFTFLARLGEGGMGEVWQVQREVAGEAQSLALKLLRADHRGPEAFARFLREQQILLQLDHPNIARLYDAGKTPSGQPWLAMELVDGQNIISYCDQQRLGIRERLALFRQVLLAVQFAHERFIVHRDIKPENVMVNAAGQVKLLDFGIAKSSAALAKRDTTQRYFSAYSVSPEQLSGGVISVMTDIYALGALLYELLSGKTLISEDLSMTQLHDLVLHQTAKLPSVRLDAAAAETRGLKRIGKGFGLSTELDKIVMHALRKKPDERYRSAPEFLHDIDAFLRGLPVTAVGLSRGYVLGKFIRRHWLAVSSASAALLLLAGLTALLAWRGEALALANQEANSQRQATEAVNRFLIDAFKRADPLAPAGNDRSLGTLIDASFAEFKENQQLDSAHTPMLLALAEGLIALGKSEQASKMLRELQNKDVLNPTQDLQSQLLLASSAQSQSDPEALRKALTPLRAVDPSRLSPEQVQRIALLEAQLANSLGHAERALAFLNFETAPALRVKVSVLVQLRRFDEAQAVLQRWQALPQQSSLDKPLIASAKSQIAEKLGQREQARVFADMALQEAIALYGEEHSNILSYENSLAGAEMRLGQFAAARDGYSKLLQSAQKFFAPDSARLRFVRYNLALANAALGKLSSDEQKLLERYAQDEKAIYGLTSLCALARVDALNDRRQAFAAKMQKLDQLLQTEVGRRVVLDDVGFLQLLNQQGSIEQLKTALQAMPYEDQILNQHLIKLGAASDQ